MLHLVHILIARKVGGDDAEHSDGNCSLVNGLQRVKVAQHQRSPRKNRHWEARLKADLKHALGDLELVFDGLVLTGHDQVHWQLASPVHCRFHYQPGC